MSSQVLQAIILLDACIVHTLHWQAQKVGVLLEEGNVVQRDVAIDELEYDGLRKQSVGMLRVSPIM